jgi:hypothetical protein
VISDYKENVIEPSMDSLDGTCGERVEIDLANDCTTNVDFSRFREAARRFSRRHFSA